MASEDDTGLSQSSAVPRDTGPSGIETLFKTVVALAPIVGGSAATIIGDMEARRRARLQQFGHALVDATSDPHELVARIASDERLADMLIRAVAAASVSSVEMKRVAMGKVIAAACADDADVDIHELLLSTLIVLESPHFAALARIEQMRPATMTAEMAEELKVASVVNEAAQRFPEPVRAMLVAQGAVATETTYDGLPAIVGLSSFGRMLFNYVAQR